MAYDSKTPSEFNMALAHLESIRKLQNAADQASISLDAHNWFHILNAIFREISTYMNPDDKNATKKYMDNIQPLLRKNNHISKHHPGTILPDLYSQLHNYDMYLRQVLDNGGLLTKRQDDASKALK
jgi:hypothetical protein